MTTLGTQNPTDPVSSGFLDRRAANRALRNKTIPAINGWSAIETAGTRSATFRPLIEQLLQNNQIETALDLLHRASRHMPLSKPYSLRQLQSVATWLAREGHLSDALAILRKSVNADPHDPVRRTQYINFLYLFQIVDPAEIPRLVRFLDEDLPPLAISRATELILSASAAPDQAKKGVERALQAAEKTSALPQLVAMLAEHYASTTGQPDRLEALLARFGRLFSTQDKAFFAAPHLAALARAENQVPPTQITQAAEVLHQLKDGQEALFALFRDPNIRIAVVGNSPNALGAGKGAEIDDHDVVIRFNRFSLDSQYHADLGQKTDVVVQTISTFQGHAHPRKAALLQALKGSPHRFLWKAGPPELDPNLDVLKEFIANGVRLASMTGEAYHQLNLLLRSSSSSGIQILWTLFQLRGSLDNVGTYGFSFVDQVGTDRAPSNYFRNAAPSFGNNWPGEAQLLRELKAGTQPDNLPDKRTATTASFSPRSDFRPLRLRLIGDHSDYHCGCQAVMNYLTALMKRYGVLVEDDSYDILVANGEGSMHRNRRNHIQKMEALRAALDAGKRAMLINTVWQENDARFDDVLGQLSFISAREPRSQQELIRTHGVEAQMFLDCSYWASISKPDRVEDFTGKTVLTDFYSQEFNAFVKITSGSLSRKSAYISLADFDWPGLVHSLRSARLLVTGRHHAFFAACRAEIPFVVVPGNTHKIEAVIEASGVDIPICRDPSQLDDAMAWARANRPRYQALFRWMRAQPKLAFPGHTLFRNMAQVS